MSSWEATYKIKMKGVTRNGMTMLTFAAPNFDSAVQKARTYTKSFGPKCKAEIMSVEPVMKDPPPAEKPEPDLLTTGPIGFAA